jgi:hypothetical protein
MCFMMLRLGERNEGSWDAKEIYAYITPLFDNFFDSEFHQAARALYSLEVLEA